MNLARLMLFTVELLDGRPANAHGAARQNDHPVFERGKQRRVELD